LTIKTFPQPFADDYYISPIVSRKRSSSLGGARKRPQKLEASSSKKTLKSSEGLEKLDFNIKHKKIVR
jgi:hypothetical protein